MRYSNLFVKTTKENPADETALNAQLLIRAGFIKKEMAGVYSFLPLGLRVIRKIETIVREEMDRAGAIEIKMSELCPKENWQTTGRWDKVDVLYKLEMSEGKEVALSPTHEEIVTPLVQQFCRSYKDLPLCVYQIQSKFRNEPRAKSGLLRGREFLMKDAYSFHASVEDFEKYYEVQKKAYEKIYDRLGIGHLTICASASGGDFTELFSHEFQTKADIGEDEIFHLKGKEEYFNKEILASQAPKVTYDDKEMLPMEEVEGKGIIGVEALAKFLNISVEKTTKTILFENEKGEVIAAAVRGLYEIDTDKLKKIVGCKTLELASEETVKRVTKAEVGYAGILNLPDEVTVYMDESMEGRLNFEMGANRTDYHSININFERDLPLPEKFYDFKVAQKGDLDPETGEVYEVFNAIEVGNIFPLETKFTDAFKFKFVDEDGKEKPVIMGCYGIGISRTMGVLAELFADEKGLKWPEQVAPFQVYLAAIGKGDEAYEKASELYAQFQEAGIEVLYDDRREKKIGPGQKFADHELMGIPVRAVVSERLLPEGKVEVVWRDSGEVEMVGIEEVVKLLNS